MILDNLIGFYILTYIDQNCIIHKRYARASRFYIEVPYMALNMVMVEANLGLTDVVIERTIYEIELNENFKTHGIINQYALEHFRNPSEVFEK